MKPIDVIKVGIYALITATSLFISGYTIAYTKYYGNFDNISIQGGSFVACNLWNNPLEMRNPRITCYVPTRVYDPKTKADL